MEPNNREQTPTRIDFTKAVTRIREFTPEEAAAAEAKCAKHKADMERHDFNTRLDRLIGDLGPRYKPAHAALSRFQVYHQAQQPVLDRLRAIVDRLKAFIDEGRGLILFGPVGTGKDHLLAAILYQAVKASFAARWVNGQEAYGQIRDRMDTGESEESYFRDLSSYPLLAISDPVPPVGAPSAWNVSQLYRLIDRRYRALRPTWMSLNATSPEDADAKLSAPVFDRLRDGAELIPCFWPSFRRAAPASNGAKP